MAAWHEQHEAAAAALEAVTALPAHVMVEAYSVLTRLPSGLAVAPALAANTLTERFHGSALRLGDEQRASLLPTLADAGVLGGASYDGLIALEAKTNGELLLTLDDRAGLTYQRLATPFRVIRA